MAKLEWQVGATSKILRVFIQDSGRADAGGLPGLTNASAGLTAYYMLPGGSAPVQITLAAGTVGTWSSGGFKEVHATNFPGLYELGLPNAMLAALGEVQLILRGAAAMVVYTAELQMVLWNPSLGVRLDFTQLLTNAPVAGSVGAAMLSAWAETFGKIVASSGVVTFYATDGSTIFSTKTVTGNAPSDFVRQ